MDSRVIDYNQRENWLQQNTELLEEVGKNYQQGLQSIVVGIGIASYCFLMLTSIAELNIGFLLLLNTMFAISLFTIVISGLIGAIYEGRRKKGSKDKNRVKGIVWRKIKFFWDTAARNIPVPVVMTSIFFGTIIIFLQLVSFWQIITGLSL